MRETFVAVLLALLILYFLTHTQWGSNLFFTVKGSTAAGPGNQQAVTQ